MAIKTDAELIEEAMARASGIRGNDTTEAIDSLVTRTDDGGYLVYVVYKRHVPGFTTRRGTEIPERNEVCWRVYPSSGGGAAGGSL